MDSKKKEFFCFCFFFLGGGGGGGGETDMVLGKKMAIFNSEWGQSSAPRVGQKIPWWFFKSSCGVTP